MQHWILPTQACLPIDFYCPLTYNGKMQTIIETDKFSDSAKKLLSRTEYEDLFDVLADDPTAGNVIKGAGGFRKLRLARDGGGKSGGYRVIYLFGGGDIPIVLFDIYAKNEKENLTQAEVNKLAAAAKIIIKGLKR